MDIYYLACLCNNKPRNPCNKVLMPLCEGSTENLDDAMFDCEGSTENLCFVNMKTEIINAKHMEFIGWRYLQKGLVED